MISSWHEPTDTDSCYTGQLLNRPLCVLKQLFKVLRHCQVLELCHSLSLSSIPFTNVRHSLELSHIDYVHCFIYCKPMWSVPPKPSSVSWSSHLLSSVLRDSHCSSLLSSCTVHGSSSRRSLSTSPPQVSQRSTPVTLVLPPLFLTRLVTNTDGDPKSRNSLSPLLPPSGKACNFCMIGSPFDVRELPHANVLVKSCIRLCCTCQGTVLPLSLSTIISLVSPSYRESR